MELLIVITMTALISCIDTVSYAARLSAARTRRVGASGSLFNILVIFSRFAVMAQMLVLGWMLDRAIHLGRTDELFFQLRFVLLSMSGGIVVGMLILPSVARILAIGTLKLDQHGSVPKIVFQEGLFRTLRKLPSQFWLPSFRANWRQIRAADLTYSFLLMNAVIFSFYSIANLSALLAGAMVPGFRSFAQQMASVINGVGTILLVIFVDPLSAKLMDDVVIEKRPLRDLKAAVFQLGVGRLLGTFIAQLLLWPFAYFIKWVVLLFPPA
ncbi:lipid II flippase family protein [Brevibacillus sp. B_LB10_24]|uniref:lipid II flippase family protein n=1 Tax=Brevibacillus sp. B_LB10_24 TaxID=3380645 RepID=UPI0038BC5A03